MVLGLTTNLRFLRWLVRQRAVVRGQARIDTLDATWRPDTAEPVEIPADAWTLAARELGAGGWRLNGPATGRLVADGAPAGTEERSVRVEEAPAASAARAFVRSGGAVHVDIDGRSIAFRIAPPPDVDRAARAAAAHGGSGGSAEVVAPMPGAVLAVHAAVGDHVVAGDPIVTLEAMKMEHVVTAAADGRVAEIRARPGDQVVAARRSRRSKAEGLLRYAATTGGPMAKSKKSPPEPVAGQHHAPTKAHGRPTRVDKSLPADRDKLLALHAQALVGARAQPSAARSTGQPPTRSAGSRSGSPTIDRSADPPRG